MKDDVVEEISASGMSTTLSSKPLINQRTTTDIPTMHSSKRCEAKTVVWFWKTVKNLFADLIRNTIEQLCNSHLGNLTCFIYEEDNPSENTNIR